MDMSPAFISGRDEYFPQAEIVCDEFHTWYSTSIKLWTKFEKQSIRTAICLNASDTLSLETAQSLKRNYAWTRCLILPNIGEAYGLREGFMDTYLVPDKEEAKGYLAFWCDVAIDAKLEPFRKFVSTISIGLV